MATLLKTGLGLVLALGLGGWNAPPPPRDPDVGESWYPLACRVLARQFHDRIDWQRTAGHLDPPDAEQFAQAARRSAGSCETNGFATLHLLISLGRALDEWHVPGKAQPDDGGIDVLSARDPGIEPGSGLTGLRR